MISFVLSTIIVFFQLGQPLPSITLPIEIDRVLRDYEAGWRNRDGKALAALFAEDGYVLSSGSEPVKGRDNIERHYSGSGGELVLRAIHFERQGNLAILIGGFSRKPGEADVGKFTLSLRRAKSGKWLILSDMDNGNSRPKL